jgi:hypothetical protein
MRHCEKGVPKQVLMAIYLDPCTKSEIVIQVADHKVMWQFIEDELLESAFTAVLPIPGVSIIQEAPNAEGVPAPIIPVLGHTIYFRN